MCWRDDIVEERYCSICHQPYHGDFGHRGCPGFRKSQAASPPPEPEKSGEVKETAADPQPVQK